MINTEILAPAGGKEQLIAAVRCGADAVYLGTERFNARNSATNFNEEALREAVKYCHARDVRVYVTMNTLVTDTEIEDVTDEIKMIAASGADAVIIQDLAVAALWKKHCPSMKLHASTQMTIHNLQGAKEAVKLGFSRIVLARELTKSEIENITGNVDAEIEVFVHGALCMSVSGACLLSSMIGSRSGNRGRCAQPCRLNFNISGREYALSLKDLSLIDNMRELAEIGVKSFKIEGRMKRPEYVAAAVTAVRKSLSGEKPDTEKLRAVFSRSGFTKGYFEGKRNLEMFGYRRHEDVTAAAGVLKELAVLYKDEISKIPVSVLFSANKNSSSVTVSDGKNEVSVDGPVPEEARSKPLDEDFVKKCFSKTGGTVFVAEKFSISLCDGLSLSASDMNAMRREALERLYEERFSADEKEFIACADNTKRVYSAASRKKTYRLRFERYQQAFDDVNAEKIILPLSQILKNPGCAEKFRAKLVCEIPFLVFDEDEKKLSDALDKIQELGIKEVLADNIGTLSLAREKGFTVHGGHGLNVLNSLSFTEYEKLGCADITASPELSMKALGSISAKKPKGVIGYGFLPLMRFRVCPAMSVKGCAECKGLSVVKDRIGVDFYIICSGRKYSSLLNSVPVYIGDKPHDGADFVTLYFTFEKEETCRKIFSSFCQGQSLPMKKTGGLYYRELL